MRKGKRVLAVFLTLSLVVGLCPGLAFAVSQDGIDTSLEVQAEIIARGAWGTCPWEIDAEGTLTVYPGEGVDTGKVSPWYGYRSTIKNVVFAQDDGKKVVAPFNISSLFGWWKSPSVGGNGFQSIVSIDFSGFDTQNVVTMEAMVEGCTKLTSLDLSSFDTSNVSNMDSMFASCSKLENIDLSAFDTSKVKNMRSMFESCSSLEFLDLSSFETRNVTDMTSMFEGCSKLASVDLSSFNTSKVESMGRMFGGCSKLASVDLSSFDTSKVSIMSMMFYGCRSLVDLDLSCFNTSNVTTMKDMFYGCSSLVSIDLSSFSITAALIDQYGHCDTNYELNDLPKLSHVVVGPEFSFRITNSKIEYIATVFMLPSGDWFSTASKKVYTTQEVRINRNSIADTYIKVPETPPIITEGDGESWAQGEIDGAVFKSDADIALLVGVRVDGVDLEESDYVASAGSTVVELKPGYLKKLAVGEHTIGITSLNGTAEASFTITRSLESAAELSLAQQKFVYDGAQKKPAVTVKVEDVVLREGVDYEVVYPDTSSVVGTYSVIVTGKGSYSGTKTIFYEITPISITDVALGEAKYTHDDTQKRPAIAVKAGDKVLQEGVDYEVSYPDASAAVGIYTVTVIGKGNYTGTKTVSYEIAPASIADVTLSETKYTYDGAQKRPSVTVKCGSRILATGSDYTVSYPASSSAVGIYTVTVTGKGNYIGTKQATFEIVEASKPTPDEPKPDNPGSVDPKPDDPSTHPDNPGTTDPGPGNPGTQPEGPGIADPQPDNPGATDPTPDDGDKPAVTDPEHVAAQVMYRAYNPNSGEHFYTASYGEIEAIVAAGWQYEGEAWTAPVTSTVPVYRLYSGTDHHYTTSAYERDELLKVGWSDEGVGWYSDEAMGVGLHRLFNPNVNPNAHRNNSGSHHYTTSDEERDFLVSIGWQYEGFGWYGVK